MVSGIVLGDNVYAKKQKFTALPLFAKLLPVPPFVCFTFATATAVLGAEVRLENTQFNADHEVEAIPWKLILKWIELMVPRQSAFFLQQLTLAYPKTELTPQGPTRKRKQEELIPVCTYRRHQAVTGRPTTITSQNIDTAFYTKHGVVMCLTCTDHMEKNSLDGFLHKKHALSLLQHMKTALAPKFARVVEVLIEAFACTRGNLMFYEHVRPIFWEELSPAEVKQAQAQFIYGAASTLLAPGLQLTKILAKKKTRDFGLAGTKQNEIRLFFQMLALYRVFGKEVVLPQIALKKLTPLKVDVDAECVRLVVVSVLDPSLVANTFRETAWTAAAYAHVYVHPSEKLAIPGVASVQLQNAAAFKLEHSQTTLVLWPAHCCTVKELNTVAAFGTKTVPVILAGTPHVVSPRAETYGFTALFDTARPFTFYGPETGLSKLLEGVNPPLPIPVSVLSTPKHTYLSCPVYSEEGKMYYHRSLFLTLLSNFPYKDRISSLVTVVPGPLSVANDAELALCG